MKEGPEISGPSRAARGCNSTFRTTEMPRNFGDGCGSRG
jgi:hypothetical protein